MKVTLSLPMTNGLWCEVDAELLFSIAPHLADVATFAVHADPDSFFNWKVSNVETGMYVVKGEQRAGTIKEAAKRLASKTPDDFESAYGKAIATFAQLRGELA